MRAYDAFEPLADPSVVTGPLEAQFGIPPTHFASHRFWHRPSARSIWIADAGLQPPPGIIPEAFGMLVARMKGRFFKPTSVFIQRFGHAATRNRYRLDEAAWQALLAHEPVPLAGVDDGGGLVILCDLEGCPLGIGLLRGGVLESLLPRAWSLNEG